MRIYEEYATPTDKRRAQKGAKLCKATGKAKGYLFVFNEDGMRSDRDETVYDALGECLETNDGLPCSITSVTPSLNYLRHWCRRIGFATLPEVWKRAFANKLEGCLSDSVPELREARRRYRQVLVFGS